MKYRIDTLHKRGREVFIISAYMNEDGTLTRNLFPGKVFNTRLEAIHAAQDQERSETK